MSCRCYRAPYLPHRHEQVNHRTLILAQDGAEWKWKAFEPSGIWSLPFPTYERAHSHAINTLKGS